MVVTALLALGVIGVVVWCDKQLPRRGRPWSALSGLQRLLTVVALPLAAAAVTFSVFWVGAASRGSGFYDGLAAFIGVAVGAGGVALAGLTLFRLAQARPSRARSGDSSS